MTTQVYYPDKIKMTGLPFMLQGWNCVFHRVAGGRVGEDNTPVYRLEEYTLYFLIPIIGVEIRKEGGKWKFFRDCDYGSPSFQKLGDHSTPIGTWTNGKVINV